MPIPEQHSGDFIKGLPFFRGLNQADLDLLITTAAIKDYSKGTSLFIQGDPATRFFVVLNGWVKLCRNTSEGEESVIALFTRGDVFGEAAIFTEANYPFSAEIVEESKVIEIPATLLRDRAAQNPDIMSRIMASMSREMHKLQMENEHMALMTTAQRVGCLLLQISGGMIGKGGTFTFPYDKSLAASRLGMKPETFSRALGQLKSIGVTVSGPEIKIENFTRLAEFSCGHCSAELEDCKGASHKNCCNSGCMSGKQAKSG